MRILSYIALLTLFSSVNVSAQTGSRTLSLDDCIRLAREAQSSVGVALRQTEIAGASLSRARAAFLPQFVLRDGYTYNSPHRGDGDEFSFIAANAPREYLSLMTAVAPVDTSGRLRAEVEQARAARDAANANLRLARRDLRRAVSAAYFRVLLARRLVQVAKGALSEGESFENRTHLLFQKGEVARADIFRASAQVAFLEQALNQAQLEAQIANHDLASFWTEDVEAPLSLKDLLDSVPAPDSALTMAAHPSPVKPYLGRPEFDLMEANRREFLAGAKRARSDLLPQASIVFQYGIDSRHLSLGDRGYAAFVNLDIPLFDWRRAHNSSKAFKLRARQVEVNRKVAARTFSKEYQDALSRARQFYRQIRITDQQVKMSEESLRLSRIRYVGGEGSALEVVTARNESTQALAQYFSARANYLNARADLEVAVGQ